MSDFLNMQDEVIDGSPTYTITDQNGNIINENVSIELSNAVIQEGTSLNKAFFKKIVDRFDYIEIPNSNEEKMEFSYFDKMPLILESIGKNFYNESYQVVWVDYDEDEECFYIIVSNGTSGTTPTSPFYIYKKNGIEGNLVLLNSFSHTGSIRGIKFEKKCLVVNTSNNNAAYLHVYDAENDNYFRINVSSSSLYAGTYNKCGIDNNYIYYHYSTKIVYKYSRKDGTLIGQITINDSAFNYESSNIPHIYNMYIKDNEYMIFLVHNTYYNAEYLVKTSLDGTSPSNIRLTYQPTSWGDWEKADIIKYEDYLIVRGNNQLYAINPDTFKVHSSVDFARTSTNPITQIYGDKMVVSNGYYSLPDLVYKSPFGILDMGNFNMYTVPQIGSGGIKQINIQGLPGFALKYNGTGSSDGFFGYYKYKSDLYVPYTKKVGV